MACTIDHLRVSLRLRVLQDFVDAQGHHHAAGETGVLEHLDVDFATDEILPRPNSDFSRIDMPAEWT